MGLFERCGRRPAVRGDPRVRGRSDDGFSLLEQLISTALVTIVAASVLTFLATSTSLTRRQRDHQAAVRLATDGVELARSVSAPMLPAGVPTTADTATANGVPYRRAWSVLPCWESAAGGACVVQNTTPGSGYLKFFQVTVTVTWPGHDCANASCSYVTTTLINAVSAQPLFNTNS